jgi:PhzF family phenazine biosynthesis protein
MPVDLERREGKVAGAVMEQPEPRFEDLPGPAATAVTRALGLGDAQVVVADNGIRTALVRAPSEGELARLDPDMRALGAAAEVATVSVHCLPPDGAEPVRVRVFAPGAGIAEDPGTGSAAGPLADLLVRRGERPAGAIELLQGVEMHRPCLIRTWAGAGRPRVGGDVTAVARGTYVLP